MKNEIEKDTIVLLSYQVNQAFCGTKGLYKMKNKGDIGIIFCHMKNYTDVIENFQ